MNTPSGRPPVPFNNTYARLPAAFHAAQQPTPVAAPALIRANAPLAHLLGIDPRWLNSAAGVAMVAGNTLPHGAEPIATVYAGHQFGSWVPRLGDGRAILLGEVIGTDNTRRDIQLKGAGPTPYSRNGDGRAPIGPVLREYIVSEAMAALGVPTTRALAAVSTGEGVIRKGVVPGAVLARVAQSHIRVGTFEYFAARQDLDSLRLLTNLVIDRHYPQAQQAPDPCRAMFDGVVARQAELIAQWQLLGFVHGVMNTDNMLVSGETIDYGPCAFLDVYHSETVFSAIDRGGRYAYRNQPAIAQWNLAALAQALLPLWDDNPNKALESAQEALNGFPDLFASAYRAGMGKKLGLTTQLPEDDALAEDLLTLMTTEKADFTNTFRRLSQLADAPNAAATSESNHQRQGLSAAFVPWLKRWAARLEQEPDANNTNESTRSDRMCAVNPAYIPRNHQIEKVIHAAIADQNLGPFHDMTTALEHPYASTPAHARYAEPPRPDERVRQTFCGT